MFRREFSLWAAEKIEAERRNLANFYGQKIPTVRQNLIQKELAKVASDIVSLDQLDKERRKYVVSLARIETYFEENFWENLAKKGRSKRRSWIEHKQHSKNKKHYHNKHRRH